MVLRFPRQLFAFRSPAAGQATRASTRHQRRRPKGRRLTLQSLEQRHLLAAYINELMVDPLFVSTDIGQYLEIRAEPNTQLEQGTYFVAVNERGLGGLGGSVGVIHGIFDLSGVEVGSSGMLVILQQDSPFEISRALVPDGPGPSVLRSTAPGFSGLPGNLFSSLATNNVQIDSILGSNGYFLIQTDTPPELGQDIDVDNDGLIDPDGVAASWNILDSISLHHGVFQGPVAYGQIVFVEMIASTRPEVTAAEGVEVIHTPGFGYAARIGDSTGHSAEDWVAGTVREESGQNNVFRLETGILGTPLPPVFSGRRLDHLGESNFIGGVRGKLTEQFQDEEGQLATRPFSGVSFLADTNGNGERDLLTFVVEPNEYENGTVLTNRFPGVTLRTVGQQNQDFGFEIRATRQPGFNQFNTVFSHSGISFFNDDRRLRADFYRPVASVSIDIVADGNAARPTIGRLEAYNAEGELLQVVRSRALFGTGRQTITVGVEGEQIAYTVAYPDSNPNNFGPDEQASSPFGRLDRLVFRQFEAIGSADENGEFNIPALQPGSYNIVVQQQNDVQLRDPLESFPIVINRYENFRFDRLLQTNHPPHIEPATFEIDEHLPADTFIGTVIATDRDERFALSYALLDAEDSPVQIDAQSGDLFVRDPDLLDFETTPEVFVTVLVSDSFGATTSATILINLIDVNEGPIVTLGRYSVFEDADIGSPIGRLEAFDPDDPSAPVQFAIVGGAGDDAFAIGRQSGVITVVAPENIDFSQARTLTLIVEVADASDPPVVTTVEIPIAVNDANDAPEIVTQSLEIAEDAPIGAAVGAVEFIDPDVGQAHTFRILGNAGPFAIDRETGIITVARPLDFDVAAQHEITVQIVDDGTPPMGSQRSIQIDVLAVSRPPTLTVSAFSVQENSLPGTPIGRLVAFTRDGNEGFEFHSTNALQPTLLFGGKVIVDQETGELRIGGGPGLDFESGDTRLVDRVVITVGGEEVAVREITLDILDVNEPPVIASTRIGVPDGLPAGRAFGEIEVFDPERDELTLELVDGADLGVRIIDGNRLLILPGSALDDDTALPAQIVIRATDAQGLVSQASIELFRAEPLRFGATVRDVIATTGELLNFALPVEYRGENVRSLRVVNPDGAPLPPGIMFDPFSGRLSGVPMPQPTGALVFRVEVTEFDGEVEVVKQEEFELAVRRSATPLHNRFNPLDVDGNGRIEPIDALRILSVIATHNESDAQVLADSVGQFVDTVGDNLVLPLDALRVLNQLARRTLPIEGEGAADRWSFGNLDDVQRRDHGAADIALQQWLAEASLF